MSTQPSLLDQLDVCESRHGGSPESQAAHEKIIADKAAMHERILKLAKARGEYGLTLHEVAGAFGKEKNEISGRLTELKERGLLIKTDERRHGAAVLVHPDEVKQ